MTVRTRAQQQSELPRTPARRLQRPSWRDTRLVVGVGLIALATAGGALLISGLDDSVEVYAASGELVPGQPLRRGDVKPVKVQMEGATKSYLSASSAPPSGRVLRQVHAGELIPSSSVGRPAQVGMKSVTVPVDGQVAATLMRGSIVDVWVSDKRESGGSDSYAEPRRVLQRSVVGRVPEERSSALGAGGGGQDASVQLLVPDRSIDQVIDAVNTEARITLVATSDSPLRSGS